MPGTFYRRLFAFLFVVSLSTAVFSGEVLSTMRNVNAVAEAHGFRLNIVHDVQVAQLSTDLSPAQSFEILRPDGKSVTIGRLFTSCSCIQLESPKRTFSPNERALLTLRNIKPTPPAGQVYAVFVQITSPVRTTLRFDTYVQSGMAGGMSFDTSSTLGTASGVGVQGVVGMGGGDAVGLAGGGAVTAGAVTPSSSKPLSSKEYQGSANAGALAALTRQIDQELSPGTRVAAAPAVVVAKPAPDSDDEDESVEALELSASAPVRGASKPAATVKNIGVDEAEPLPPPAELSKGVERSGADVAREVENKGGGVEAGDIESEDLDDDDAPYVAASVSASAAAVRPRINSASRQEGQVEGVPSRTLTTEGLMRELGGVVEGGGVGESAGAVVDRLNLERSAHNLDDDDLGTAALLGLRDEGGYLVGERVQGGGREVAGGDMEPESGVYYATDEVAPLRVLRNDAGDVVEGSVLYGGGVEDDGVQAVRGYSSSYEGMSDVVRAEPRPEGVGLNRKPVQAVSLITIGARDMEKSIRFYEALGWKRAARGKYDQTAFFQLQGQILALYPMNDLLREQNMPGANPSPGGMTLALHVLDRGDVWAVYQRFVDAGGTALRAPTEMASGAVTSYVADPDGNAWEISWVPQFQIDEEGGLWLP